MMNEKKSGVSRTVLQLLPDLHTGGVERGTVEMSDALVQHGWNSLVVSNGGRLVDDLESTGAKHIKWAIGKKSLLTLRYIPTLIRLCKEHQVDLIHARSRVPAWIAYLAWKRIPASQRPVFVTSVHGLNSVNAYSRIMTMGQQVIAVSDTAKAYVLKHYPRLSPDKVTVIYRGVDNDAFPMDFKPGSEWLSEWNESFPQTRDAWLLTLPGRISSRKGHLQFVDLIALLRKKYPKVVGLIVGGWDSKQQSYVNQIKQRIQTMGLEDAFVWTGHRCDMKEIYSQSKLVFSLSNKPESFGRTVLEPLCMGIRCAGLDHGGVGEILSGMFPQGRLPSDASLENWAAICETLLTEDALKPLPNAYPLREMLSKEIQSYDRWIKDNTSRQG